jgi:hypothetical protein
MTGYCHYALKEWSVTVDSLLAGRQIFLLRKGGIQEQRNGFHLEHPQFFLFPTHVHQSLHTLHPSFQRDLDQHTGSKPPTLTLNTYAEVEELISIADLETLRGFDGRHTLNWATVQQRFSYRNWPGLNLLLLRVYRLPIAQQIQNLDRYDGCVSWVELENPLAIGGAEPVLAAHVFQDQVEEIRRLAATTYRY